MKNKNERNMKGPATMLLKCMQRKLFRSINMLSHAGLKANAREKMRELEEQVFKAFSFFLTTQ